MFENREKLKIAYFHQDGLITGSAISLRHFLSVINTEKFEPIVILAKEGPARKYYEALGIEVRVYFFTTFWTAPGPRCLSRNMLGQLKALKCNNELRDFVINEIKPHVIHINDKASLNVGVSLKNSGIPIVQHSRSSYLITRCKLSKHLSAIAIRNYADEIICISEDEEEGFGNFGNRSTIYNTVDVDLIRKAREKRLITRQQFKISQEHTIIGFAANVTEKKGAWQFLEICKQLSYNDNLSFLLVGKLEEHGKTVLGNGEIVPISPREYVEKYIEENNLKNRVIITGFREDVLELIAAMDILLSLNKLGALGRQPIEAQAAGVVVIAKAGHSGKSKVIVDGVTGYIVNNDDQLLLKIKELLSNDKHNLISRASLKHAASNFSPKTNMRKIESIYMRCIKQ